MRLRAVFSRGEDVEKDWNTKGTGVPCTRCLSSTGYLAHGNSEDSTRVKNRNMNNSMRGLIDIKEWNVVSKRKSPKQGLTSATPLTIDQIKMNNLTYNNTWIDTIVIRHLNVRHWNAHTEQCMLNSACWTVHAEQCILNNVCWTVYTEQCILNSAYWTVHTEQCTS